MRVTRKSYPGEKFDEKIASSTRSSIRAKRTARVRIDIPNPDYKLRPGMYVNIELAMDMGEGLTIPAAQ